MRGRTDHHRAVAQSGDRHDEGIALLDCANPGWRAGIDQVAGFKPVEAGYISYRFGNAPNQLGQVGVLRSEEHTSELQSLMRISYAVFCLKKKKTTHKIRNKKTTELTNRQEIRY